MTARARKGSSCPVASGLQGTDSVIAIATVNSVTNNYTVSTATLFSNSNVAFITTGNNAMSTANLVVRSTVSIPISSSSAGTQGQVVWDVNYLYVCVGTNSWKRVALQSF